MATKMKTEDEIRARLAEEYKEIRRIESDVPAGTGFWRSQRAKIIILHWVLGEE